MLKLGPCLLRLGGDKEQSWKLLRDIWSPWVLQFHRIWLTVLLHYHLFSPFLGDLPVSAKYRFSEIEQFLWTYRFSKHYYMSLSLSQIRSLELWVLEALVAWKGALCWCRGLTLSTCSLAYIISCWLWCHFLGCNCVEESLSSYFPKTLTFTELRLRKFTSWK